jgi:hypothetical protein
MVFMIVEIAVALQKTTMVYPNAVFLVLSAINSSVNSERPQE